MIMRSDFTIEELKKDSDPLSYACHSVAKIKLIANVTQTNSTDTDRPALGDYKSDDVRAMGELIEDAAFEIETLVDIASKQESNLSHEIKRLKAKIHELEKR